MAVSKPELTKKWLYDQYVSQHKSIPLISEESGYTTTVIISKLNEFSIYRALPNCKHGKYQCPKCYESEKNFPNPK